MQKSKLKEGDCFGKIKIIPFFSAKMYKVHVATEN